MTAPSPTQMRLLQRVLLCLLALHFAARTMPTAWRSLNTDFPNYYLAARLAHEHTDTSRIYEWQWIQREKDHREIDQRIVGLVPITPFSTLVIWPLTSLPPLSAKHVWSIFNLALLAAIIFMLPSVSGLSLLQSAILALMSYPLRFNLILGQYYVLLLAILIAACWAAQRSRYKISAILIGCAVAMKVFPFIFIFYFLRKRKWTPTLICGLTILICTAISISIFGLQMHRTYLLQVLPATLRGEGLPPFNLASNSISTVLHRLFLYEPQWNPHPALNAPWLFAILHPLLQLLFLAPIVLAIDTEKTSPQQTALEWSGLLTVSLVLSTSPGSYLFTLLLLPVAIFSKYFVDHKRYTSLAILLTAFFAVGYPAWHIHPLDGWGTLLGIPRLYALIAIWLVIAYHLLRQRTPRHSREQLAWAAALVIVTTASILSNMHHQRSLFDDYAYRIPTRPDLLMAAHPAATNNQGIAYIGLSLTGYHALAANPFESPQDQLALATSNISLWTEDVARVSTLNSANASIPNAESPVVSPDGNCIAYLRELNGSRQLFLRSLTAANTRERQLTTAPYNIYEATFLPSNDLIVSATRNGSSPSLYHLTQSGNISPLIPNESRYPAASPDGHWVAFSRFVSGNWNLSLLDLQTGHITSLSRAPCNQIDPSWKPDSATLLYASDCGRSLWFTALERRRIIPMSTTQETIP